jgi:catechol 2,3-dioxygenase-like lactoylglutathione lyase family enzyme
MNIDHIGLRVRDFGKSVAFYKKACEPLGWVAQGVDEAVGSAGFGAPGAPVVWLSRGEGGGGVHIALGARDRNAVKAFHAAACAGGGKDNGAPGLRADYGPGYFAAFVLDPDGNNVEAVAHE